MKTYVSHSCISKLRQYHVLCRFDLILAALLGLAASTIQAKESLQEIDPCAKDPAICRKLAIEIAKMDIAEIIHLELNTRPERYALCPENVPDCCPAEHASSCMDLQKRIIENVRQWHRTAPFSGMECPLTAAACNELGALLHDHGETFSVTAGCVRAYKVDPPYLALATQTSSPLCPCGMVHNDKGLCVHCYQHGHPVTCAALTKDCASETQIAIADPPAVRSDRLQRHLTGREVQLEAISRLRNDLQATLRLLESHAASLKVSRGIDGEP